jgi:hypothetical protein
VVLDILIIDLVKLLLMEDCCITFWFENQKVEGTSFTSGEK